MLANLRRKIGLGSGIQTPVPHMGPPPAGFADMVVTPTSYVDPSLPQPFTMEELGFAPGDRNIVSPAAIPLWLQEQVRPRHSSLPRGYLTCFFRA